MKFEFELLQNSYNKRVRQKPQPSHKEVTINNNLIIARVRNNLPFW